MKKVALTAAILAVVVIVGVVLLVSNLDQLVAGLINSKGSEVTGTDVTVSGVDISLKEGKGAIDGLTIASPDGFDPPHAFALGGITIDIDLGSLRDDPVVVEEIRVTRPKVAAQFLADGSSNIGAIKQHVDRFSAAAGGGQSEGDPDQGSKDVKRLRIKRFDFDGGHIALDAAALGDGTTREVALPAFSLTDIGGAQGALPDEIAKAVLGALTRKATEAVARSGIEQKLKDEARKKLEEEAGEAARDLLDKLGG